MPNRPLNSIGSIWILPVSTRIGSVLLSPEIRLICIAKEIAKSGFKVKLVLSECEIPLPDGVEIWSGNPRKLPLEQNDFIVANPFLPFKTLFAAVRGRSRLIADFYSVHLPEFIQEESLHASRIFMVQRRRIWLRYKWLLRNSTYCIFSNPAQLSFLSGGLTHNSSLSDLRTASGLPSKSIFCPIGFDPDENTVDHHNPYPSTIQNRKIFLWGGGIWPWMDLDPLLQAFSILKNRGSNACLFFLSGVAADSSNRLNHPVETVRNTAESLGLLNNNVFLNSGPSPFKSRIGFLQHCTAGILCNPPTLESLCSWRTRLLDLLLVGRSAVVAGYDPLSRDLAKRNAIECTTLDPVEIANSIEKFESANYVNQLEDTIHSLADQYTWHKTLSPLIQKLKDSSEQKPSKNGFNWLELLRFVLPF